MENIESPIKTAIIRIAEKIDYLEQELAEIRNRRGLGRLETFAEELEELLKEVK